MAELITRGERCPGCLEGVGIERGGGGLKGGEREWGDKGKGGDKGGEREGSQLTVFENKTTAEWTVHMCVSCTMSSY